VPGVGGGDGTPPRTLNLTPTPTQPRVLLAWRAPAAAAVPASRRPCVLRAPPPGRQALGPAPIADHAPSLAQATPPCSRPGASSVGVGKTVDGHGVTWKAGMCAGRWWEDGAVTSPRPPPLRTSPLSAGCPRPLQLGRCGGLDVWAAGGGGAGRGPARGGRGGGRSPLPHGGPGLEAAQRRPGTWWRDRCGAGRGGGGAASARLNSQAGPRL
jgi:hypothetical protein